MKFDLNQRMDIEDGVNAYKVQEKAAQQAHEWNLPMGQIPVWANADGTVEKYQGQIPPDLTILSDDHLGMYMTLLSNWIEYVGGKVALTDNARTQAKEQMKFVAARIRLTFKNDEEGKRRSNPERDDMVTTDPRFVEANSRYLYFENLHAYTKTALEAAEQKYKAVSRRVTQRENEISRGTRGGLVGNLRPGQIRRP